MAATRRFATALMLLAAPLAGAQADLLTGTWRASRDGQAVEITFSPDGAFVRRDIGLPGAAMTVTGHWMLAGSGPWLRLVIHDWTPREACGLLGCTAIPMLPGETYRYVLQGSDRLLLEDTGGRTEFRRAG